MCIDWSETIFSENRSHLFHLHKSSNQFLFLAGSSASGSSRKEKGDKSGKKSSSPAGSGSDTDTVASARRGPASENIPPGNLGVPPDVSGSRQSFRMAMGNPCEFFVDVM